MFNVAICDDDFTVCSKLEEIILSYAKINCLDIVVEVFSSGEEFCEFTQNSFDLIYLDIEMGKMSGIEVGYILRKDRKDQKTQIVFISSKNGYDRMLFDVQPMHFIPKPLDEKIVIDDLILALELSEKLNQFFVYNKGTEYIKIDTKNIIYFETQNRKIKIVTTSEQDCFYGSMEKVYEKVSSLQFLRIHRCYLINYIHTNVFLYENVIMSNGQELPISQPKRKDIRKLQLYMK